MARAKGQDPNSVYGSPHLIGLVLRVGTCAALWIAGLALFALMLIL